MDSPTTVPLVFAIAIPNMFLWAHLDRLMKRRTEEILTGLFNGQLLEARDRQAMYVSWLIAIALGSQGIFTLGYWMLAENAATRSAKLFAGMYAAFSATGVVAHLFFAGTWFMRIFRLTFRKMGRRSFLPRPSVRPPLS